MAETYCPLVEGSLEYDAMYTVFGRVMIAVDPNGAPQRTESFDAKRAVQRIAHHPEGLALPSVASEEAFVRTYAALALLFREEYGAVRARFGSSPPTLALLMERDVLRLVRAEVADLFREHAGALVFEEFTSGRVPRYSGVVDVQRAYLPGGRLETRDECRAFGTAVSGNRWYTTTVEGLAARFGVVVEVPASVAEVQRRWRP